MLMGRRESETPTDSPCHTRDLISFARPSHDARGPPEDSGTLGTPQTIHARRDRDAPKSYAKLFGEVVSWLRGRATDRLL